MEINTIEELEAFIPLIGDFEDIRTALEAYERLGLKDEKLKQRIHDTIEDIEQY